MTATLERPRSIAGKPPTQLEAALAKAISDRENATQDLGVLLQAAAIINGLNAHMQIRPVGKACVSTEVCAALKWAQDRRIKALLEERCLREAMAIVAESLGSH
jgi:hypothetical protein